MNLQNVTIESSMHIMEANMSRMINYTFETSHHTIFDF